MKNLTPERIQELASLPGVKKIAVENFLGTLEGLAIEEAIGNLQLDTMLYKWGKETVRAIQTGIQESMAQTYGRKSSP